MQRYLPVNLTSRRTPTPITRAAGIRRSSISARECALPTTDKVMYNGENVDEDSIFRGVAVLVLVVDGQVKYCKCSEQALSLVRICREQYVCQRRVSIFPSSLCSFFYWFS